MIPFSFYNIFLFMIFTFRAHTWSVMQDTKGLMLFWIKLILRGEIENHDLLQEILQLHVT